MIWLTKVGPITLLEIFYFVTSYQCHEIIINYTIINIIIIIFGLDQLKRGCLSQVALT